MFILHSSNKTENLLAHLTAVIENMPLSSALAKETFLIQSQGMERWLSQQLASRFSVWGNYEFLFPGKFFSTIASNVDQRLNNDLFDREFMLWRFDLLLRHIDGDGFKTIRQYISGENSELKRFQLAAQLAQVFDQYQIMRPDMLNIWQTGSYLYDTDTEHWQQALWQKILQQTDLEHRGLLWQSVIDILIQTHEGELSNRLPERIFVFGLNTMPPLFLDYLQAVSRHCDIHLFLLNPAQVYWADIASKKQQIVNDDLDTHPLLSTLAQQGREFQQMLLEQVSFSYEPDSFELNHVSNLLQQLQNDILDNRVSTDNSRRILSKDNSLSIHSCHSRMREVEVLKNQLLQSLELDSSLELRDIIVMTPDIQSYAPYISAVFNDIQHTIADRSLRLNNALLDVFIKFLKLSQSRFGWQSVMDLLEQPSVYSSFSISEPDLDLIKHWVADTHVRWGKSAEHKKELGLPEFNENTWQASLDRLLMGYAIATDDQFIDDILPYPDIEGTSALILGSLNDFIQLLFKVSQDLKQPMSLSNWKDKLNFYADQLISTKSTAEQLQKQQLNELIENLADYVGFHSEEVSLAVILAWMESRMSEQKSSIGFLRGQLTFCSMLPMRSIPFKVIALMGLNLGEFPAIDRQPSFDLIAQNYRKGDRSRRADDRYQFLEILLSAREQLIITYIGQSNTNNEDIPPSVVLSELVEVMESDYQCVELITKHPLQPFSCQYFNNPSTHFSYSTVDYEIAVSLQSEKSDPQPWWQGTIMTNETDIIDIDDLFSFYRHPQQYFIQKQLDIRLSGLSVDIEEREPFTINTLDAYSINQEWITHRLAYLPYSLEKLQAQGRWVSGTAGKLEFYKQEEQIEQFVEEIKQLNLGDKIENQTIDIQFAGYRLIGNLNHLYENGSLIYRYTKTKGKDFMLAWLHHLIINQVKPQNTNLLSMDKSYVFSSALDLSTSLEPLIEIYLKGKENPNHFFTESSYVYVEQAYKLKMGKKAKKPALNAALEQLEQEIGYDQYMQQLYQNVEDVTELLNDDFEKHCNDLISPTWEAMQNHHLFQPKKIS